MTIKAQYKDISEAEVVVILEDGDQLEFYAGPQELVMWLASDTPPVRALLSMLNSGQIKIGDFVPPPARPTVVAKVDFFERMTEEEAESVEGAIAAQSARNRRIFESAQTFRSDHELWGLLNQLADQLFTPERKTVILAPS